MSILREQFKKVFNSSAEEIRIFFAPGRVNLIGEHTDFTGGYVLPAALSYGTWAAVRLRKDGKFCLTSTSFDEKVEFDTDRMDHQQEEVWANYPKGVIREFDKFGFRLSGCDMLFDGNIPKGAGLSSSASIEMVTAIAIKELETLDLSRLKLIQLSQRAENQFVGVNCGIMDQFASGMGKAGHALLLKCDSLAFRNVPLYLGDYQLVLTNSNKPRSLTQSKYNQRRQECEAGEKAILKYLPSVSCLGDVTLEQWESVPKKGFSPEAYKRLDHVVHENARVLASTIALEAGDIETFGKYMVKSHESLRDLFEVTGPELDTLFEESRQTLGCLGTRMTGAGFGGCTVSLVHKEAIADFEAQVTRGYQAKTGLTPTFYSGEIGDGVHEILAAI
nr:galactokinase [Desulfosporosinus acidiphilus]